VTPNRAAAVAVIAIAVSLFGLTFGFEQMPVGITRGFGAEAFPRLVLGTIVVLALLLFAGRASGERQPSIPGTVYTTAASLLLFMAIVPLVGMLPAMFLFLLALGYLWGERRHWLLLLSAAVMTVAIWGVFVRGFGVQLPKGLFA
jgi:hypothetical protein